MDTKVDGGYRPITVGQLANICAARIAKILSPTAFRVYLGCHILVASRCKAPGNVHFTIDELDQRIGRVGTKKVEKAIEELESLGLLSWCSWEISFSTDVLPEAAEIAAEMQTNANRPVPIPRRIIRALARHKKTTEAIAAIAHLIRCLFKKKSTINSKGLVKASWIADIFGVSIRTVHAARQWLIEKKFIIPVKVHQLVMNKYGACFRVILRIGKERKKQKNAGPIKQQVLSTCTNQNNKTITPPKGGEAGFSSKKTKNPQLTNIQFEDLRRLSSLEKLYGQAINSGWLEHSEANVRNFVSAAVRATRVSGNAVKIFVGIVKKGLWHHITHEQEERALTVLKRYRDKNPDAFKSVGSSERNPDRFNQIKEAKSPKKAEKGSLLRDLTGLIPGLSTRRRKQTPENRQRIQELEFERKRLEAKAMISSLRTVAE